MACVGAKQLTQEYFSQLTLIVTDKTTDLCSSDEWTTNLVDNSVTLFVEMLSTSISNYKNND